MSTLSRCVVAAAAALVPLVVVELPAGVAGAADAASVSCSDAPATAPAPDPTLASFTASAPRRLVDTRDGTGGVSDDVGAGCTLHLDLDAAGVPADADAVALSVTALAADPGYLSVFPCNAGRPNTSNLNTRPNRFPTPNLVVALPDSDRDVCIFSLATADVIVDVTGHWSEAGTERFASITPARAYDSRAGGGPRLAAGTPREIDVTNVVPATATAVVANLTVTGPLGNGFAVAFPCGAPAPLASNVNYLAGESRAVAMVVGLGGGAKLCVQTSVAAHVVVDVAGYYAPAPQFGPTAALRPLAGRRLADSRDGTGGWASKFAAGTVQRLTPTSGISGGEQATAVVLNVVAIQPEAAGFVSIYPCDEDRPLVSSVNYAPTTGQSTNLVTVELSGASEICFYTLTPVHLVVDLFGMQVAPDGSLAERLSFDRFTWPPFHPAGTDYAVECGATGTTVRLVLDRLAGVTSRVNGVPVAGDGVDLAVAPDSLTTVVLQRGAVTTTYHFRCVPTDFPRLDVRRPGSPAPGWYMTTLTDPTTQATFLVILDEYGAPTWYKRAEAVLIDFKRRSDGRLVAVEGTTPFGTDPAKAYRVMSLSGTLVAQERTVDPTTYPLDHHDYVELPGGGHAVLSYPLTHHADLSSVQKPGGGTFSPDETVADGVIQEIDAGGGLLWQWRASTHIPFDESTYPFVFPAIPGVVDVWHFNSLERVADGTGDYVVSGRHLDAVFRVDRATGDIDWILGGAGPTNAAKRLAIVNDPLGGPKRPHDARLTGDVLTLFDNRTATGQPARAVAYRIDAGAHTATLLWQITEPGGRTSVGLGVTRVGSDGSVLVDWGGVIQPMFAEYDANHDLMMSIEQVGDGSTYRITKVAKTTWSPALLRALAGGNIEAP